MKNYVILILIMTVSVLSHAQKVRFGASAGIGISAVPYYWTEAYVYETNPGISFEIGSLTQIPFGKKSHLEVEVKWLKIQSEEYLSSDQFYGSASVDLNHVKIPIFWRYNLRKIGLKGGVIPALYVNGRYDSESYSHSGDQKVNVVNKKGLLVETKPASLAIAFGVDYEINQNFRMGLKGNFGIQNFSNPHPNLEGDYLIERTYRQLTFGVDYMFK